MESDLIWQLVSNMLPCPDDLQLGGYAKNPKYWI
jgi:hypothetical protein